MLSEREARRRIVEIGDQLHAGGYIAGAEGNISVRLDGQRILSTPTGVSKRGMHPEDLVVVDLAGERVPGQPSRRHVSSEIGVHLLIYRMRAEITGVVHAHPPVATGFAVAGIALDRPLVPEIVVSLGSVPLVPYATPGTPALAQALEPFVAQHDAVLLANHGVVTWGHDVCTAHLKMETVEQIAKITLAASRAGTPRELPAEEVDRLLAMREVYFANGKKLYSRQQHASSRGARASD